MRTGGFNQDKESTARVRDPKAVVLPTRSSTIPRDTQDLVTSIIHDRIKLDLARDMPRELLRQQIEEGIRQIADERRLQLTSDEQVQLAYQITDDMQGVGPLEALLRDEDITDIMVNGPREVYVERGGRVILTDVRFRDENHLRQAAARMANGISRRLDEKCPMVDARLKDGSRVNIVIPPISLRGTLISIRRFPNAAITLDTMLQGGSIDRNMKMFFEIAAKCGLNVLISGGTSSGKTTLLNALSQHINSDERIVTIEDTAELRLQQNQVLPLETRPRSLEGSTEITQRDLVKNALRMRPDRIILGEVRQGEAFDMLQAMNTGHDGSMGTMHANTPRDALARLENMILMAGFELPMRAIRTQIVSAVDLIIQAERCPDGKRRVVAVSEVTSIEGDTITMQELFTFQFDEARSSGSLIGSFRTHNAPSQKSMQKFARHGMSAAASSLFKHGS